MTLTVRADPTRPNGGYAELSTSANALPAGETTVTIFDAFSERYLGESGWQTESAAFGPYPVTHDGDTARLVVGPEIVNEIEEYAVLKITAGPVSDEVSWPDDVFPLPGAARLGGLQVTRTGSKPPVANLVQNVAAPPPPPEPEPEPDQTDPVSAQTATKSRTPLFFGLGALLLAAIAAGTWFFLTSTDEPVAIAAPEPEPMAASEPAPASDPVNPCGDDAFGAVASAGFSERSALMLRCAGSVDPDSAFVIIDDGVAANDPQALALMGQLYDPEVNDSPVETQIGLELPASLTLAAEYYARSVNGGNAEAAGRLAEICQTLRSETDTESRNAVEEFCNQ